MTKIPSDDILEGLYKLRIRESEKLKTVLELYHMEIHQKKAGPDYHRLKTMVKRSIEQNLRSKENLKQAPWSRVRGQNSVNKEVLENVGSGKQTGSVLKETIAVSVTISISVQKQRSRILLRARLRSRVIENQKSQRQESQWKTDSVIAVVQRDFFGGSTWVCDALSCCGILVVPLSVWRSSVSGSHAELWKKRRISTCCCSSPQCAPVSEPHCV